METKQDCMQRQGKERLFELEEAGKILKANEERWDKELAKLDKPAIKNWDYGFNGDGKPRLFVRSTGEVRALDEMLETVNYNPNIDRDTHIDNTYTIFGNLADDLKAMQCTLEEFEVEDDISYKTKLKFEIADDYDDTRRIMIDATQEGRKCSFVGTIAQAQEIHQKLGCLIATAKRRKEK